MNVLYGALRQPRLEFLRIQNLKVSWANILQAYMTEARLDMVSNIDSVGIYRRRSEPVYGYIFKPPIYNLPQFDLSTVRNLSEQKLVSILHWASIVFLHKSQECQVILINPSCYLG